uniref:hypothetical protein n=1 Tax=Hylemonella sp. TaxID=2066020 RepID=UPI0035AEF518
MRASAQPGPLADDRSAQAARVADYLEAHPASTQKEIDAVCDTGCISKVLSEMPALGYGISKGWRFVLCAAGTHRRQVRTYTLLFRPSAQPSLFPDA